MSVYHTSFNYLGINSRLKNLIVAHFDADNGEVETNLNLEPIYTDSALGMRRYDYGAKYNSVASFRITVVKPDGSDFSVAEVRGCLKWLTGTTNNTNLELLVGEKIKCVFIGRITNVWQQKLDARTVGLVLEFTNNSPFGYSPIQTVTYSINGTKTLQINCLSDDLFSYVYMQTTYENLSGDTLTIQNATTEETTKVTKLSVNETVTIDGPMAISSDKPTKVFGNTFNFTFPRLVPGINEFVIEATGNITFEYTYPMKIGNVAVDIEELIDSIDCDSNPGPGTVVVEHTAWENIWDKPHTISGYGITDAYTKTEIDGFIRDVNETLEETKNVINEDVTNKTEELHNRINSTNSHVDDVEAQLKSKIVTVQKNLESSQKTLNDKINLLESNVEQEIEELKTSNISWDRVVNTPTTLAEYGIADAYTKEEVDAKTSSVYTYKGSVTSALQLPTSNMIVGDVYNLEDSGMNVAWNGSDWDDLGSIVDLTPYLTQDSAANIYATRSNTYTKTEIDTKLDEFVSDDVYTKEEIDEKFENLDISGINTYTKEEIDEKIDNIISSGIDISEDELNEMLNEILI